MGYHTCNMCDKSTAGYKYSSEKSEISGRTTSYCKVLQRAPPKPGDIVFSPDAVPYCYTVTSGHTWESWLTGYFVEWKEL
jgi:hypothetical protein